VDEDMTDEDFEMVFTFGVILRGQLSDINKLVDFLKEDSNLIIAHKQLGQKKLWIKEVNNDY